MSISKTRFGAWLVGGILILLLALPFWYWFVERTEVPPGQYLVVIHLWGKDLPDNELVAPNPSYKGVMLDVLPEGRHFLNPLFWKTERHTRVTVPTGKCLVLTRKFGKDIPKERVLQGDCIALEGERGIVRDPLGPGDHPLNPYAYSWDETSFHDFVKISPGQVGVRTLKIGKDPRGLPVELGKGMYVVEDGYRGVQRTPVPNGDKPINPWVEAITPVDVQSHTVRFHDISFASRDGFLLTPQVVVEYAVDPKMAPELFVRLSDKGKLYQQDETVEDQQKNQLLQKVILPHIRGYARLRGSDMDAKDFILTAAPEAKADAKVDAKILNNREKLETALREAVKPRCAELGILIKSVTLDELKPPPDLAQQISERDLARVEREKNITKIEDLKAEQSLRAKEAMKVQAKEKVEAETRLLREKTRAEQLLEVEEARLKTDLSNAQLRLDAARKEAEATLAKGKAEARVIELQNEAEVAGLRKAVQGFASIQTFAQYHVIVRLAPAVAEIFASDDSELAKLVTHYLSPPAGMDKPAAAGPAKAPAVADSK